MQENYKYSVFSKKNKKMKNLKNGEKKWPDIGIYTYYYFLHRLVKIGCFS